MQKNFEQWPLGKIPSELQRIELEQVKDLGYKYNDARELVNIFEETIANFCGSKYAVSIDNCTDAIMLCLEYIKLCDGLFFARNGITIPSRVYPSVPMEICKSGFKINFENKDWSGIYRLDPFRLYDAAVRFTKNMYIKDSFMCLSFQLKKRLCIGKGGMILLDNKDMYDWLIKARYQGRDLTVSQWDDEYSMLGWNAYMTPEDAARGLIIFHYLIKQNPSGLFSDTANQDNYADMSQKKIFQPYIVPNLRETMDIFKNEKTGN